MPYKDTVLQDGTLVSAEAQEIFKGLATLAQVVGEALHHDGADTPLLAALDGVAHLMEVLPFEQAMLAAETVMGYVDVAQDHALDVAACERCGGEAVKLSPNFERSALAADLVTLLESAGR